MLISPHISVLAAPTPCKHCNTDGNQAQLFGLRYGRFTYPGEFTGSEKLGEFHPSEDVFILFPFNLEAGFNPRLITERDLAQNKSLYPRNGLV